MVYAFILDYLAVLAWILIAGAGVGAFMILAVFWTAGYRSLQPRLAVVYRSLQRRINL